MAGGGRGAWRAAVPCQFTHNQAPSTWAAHLATAPALRLCACGERQVETTEHAVLECTRYEGLRGPLAAVMRDHAAAVRDEHGALRGVPGRDSAVGYRRLQPRAGGAECRD